eukprot:1142092-Pelagomonas_calceolata.AAC.4
MVNAPTSKEETAPERHALHFHAKPSLDLNTVLPEGGGTCVQRLPFPLPMPFTVPGNQPEKECGSQLHLFSQGEALSGSGTCADQRFECCVCALFCTCSLATIPRHQITSTRKNKCSRESRLLVVLMLKKWTPLIAFAERGHLCCSARPPVRCSPTTYRPPSSDRDDVLLSGWHFPGCSLAEHPLFPLQAKATGNPGGHDGESGQCIRQYSSTHPLHLQAAQDCSRLASSRHCLAPVCVKFTSSAAQALVPSRLD